MNRLTSAPENPLSGDWHVHSQILLSYLTLTDDSRSEMTGKSGYRTDKKAITEANINSDIKITGKPSSTLHQDDSRLGINPVNVTISSNGRLAVFFWLCGRRSTFNVL